MSNLDYSIAALIAKGTKLTLRHATSPEEMWDNVGKLNGINRAISILKEEKRKDKSKKEYREHFNKIIKL